MSSLYQQPGDILIADLSNSFSCYNEDDYENISNIHVKSFNESQDMNESRIPRKSGKFEVNNTQQIQKLHQKIADLKSKNQFQLDEITDLKLKNEDLSKFLTLEKLEMIRICEAKIDFLDSQCLQNLNSGISENPEALEFRRNFEKKKMELEIWQRDEKIRKLEEKSAETQNVGLGKFKRLRSKSESQKGEVNFLKKYRKMARLLEKKDGILEEERKNWEEKEKTLMDKIEELKAELERKNGKLVTSY